MRVEQFTRIAALAALAWSGTAASQAAPTAPAEALSAICTDRPTKSNFACVVDPGHLQVEADGISYSRLKSGGVVTETWLATNPTIKYGIAKDFDVEANIAPDVIVRTRDGDGRVTTLRGPSDLSVRGKWNFYRDDRWSATVLPYVKAPTARHGIGNGSIESGVLFPINYQLDDRITLTTVPEFDALKDGDNTRHHFNTSQLVNVGVALPHDLTVYAELWGDWNVDPQRTIRQFSADVALAWGVTKDLQLDAGVNFGLNRNTPSIQAYIGVSKKF